MKNKPTIVFLAFINETVKTAILKNIAENYKISPSEAFAEVTNSAEHLLDFLSEPIRTATKILMAQHGTVIAYTFSCANATAALTTKKPAEKRSFDVAMSRLVTETLVITVMAANEDEARELADEILEAGDVEWEPGSYGEEPRTIESVVETPQTSMSLEDWILTFKPIKNPTATGDEFASAFLYETHGDDLMAVKAANPKCVWTLLEAGDDGDDGSDEDAKAEIDAESKADEESTAGMILVNGMRLVNRVNYFITEMPYDDSDGELVKINY